MTRRKACHRADKSGLGCRATVGLSANPTAGRLSTGARHVANPAKPLALHRLRAMLIGIGAGPSAAVNVGSFPDPVRHGY